jgi:monomeric isocitrate dehydrogenase
MMKNGKSRKIFKDHDTTGLDIRILNRLKLLFTLKELKKVRYYLCETETFLRDYLLIYSYP